MLAVWELAFFVFEEHLWPFVEIAKAFGADSDIAAVEPEDFVGHIAEEGFVVADTEQGAFIGLEIPFEPFDGGEVEVVGGFVEEEEVGVFDEGAG